MNMELFKAIVYPRDGKHNELLDTCRMIAEQTRKQAGCLVCHLLQNRKEENLITLEQHWEKRHFLDDYFRSNHFKALLGAMKWLGKNYEIRLNEGTKNESMDAIEKARAKYMNIA
jgi:quinol monooxygenase YgiN